MKNITLMLIFLISYTTFAQEKLTTYETSYFSGKSFDVSISKNKKGKITFWIDAMSMDKSSKLVSLQVDEKQLDNFKSILDTLKSTYIEWVKVAKENNVKELKKDINIKSKNYAAAFSYGGWKFDFSVVLKAKFMILGENKYVITLRNSNKLETSSNRYINSDGFVFAFSSEDDFDLLNNAIDLEKAKEYFKSKEEKKDLFKQ